MPDPDSKNRWNQLVDAAKDAGATGPDPSEEPIPTGFVKRVISMREGLWKFTRTLLWRRWSLAAALLAIVLFLLIYLILKSNPPEPRPVPPPSLPLPPDP